MTQDWIIGYIWANGASITNPLSHYKYFRIQNQNRELLSEIAVCLDCNVKEQSDGKIFIDINNKHPIYKRIFDLGWTSRSNNVERSYPSGSIDDLDFVRGYCKTKAHIGFHRCSKSNKMKFRLRIEGASRILEGIDNFIVSWIHSKPKKLQRQVNPINLAIHQTKESYHYILYYQSQKEVLLFAKLLDSPLPGPDVISKRRGVNSTQINRVNFENEHVPSRKKITIEHVQEIAKS
jgi:hypothetical protein